MGIRFDGLSTGLDTTAILEAILGVERQPLVRVQERQADLEAQQELFRDLNTRLLALREAAQAVDNQNSLQSGLSLDEELLAYSANSSDESFVTAVASGNASPGSLDVRVDEIAKVARRISSSFAESDTTIATVGQSLQIDFGGAQPIIVTIGAAGASLADLKDLVNADPNNAGAVRAEVLFDGGGYRLVLAGTQEGAANDITLTTDITGPGGAPFLDPAVTQQTATDARINVLGLDVTRSSNAITDLLPGVTLTLNAAHDEAFPDQSTRIDVTRDQQAIEDKLQAFVDAFNSVREFAREQSSFDSETGRAGSLSGDITLRSVERTIQRTVSDRFDFVGNPFLSIGQLGMSFDSDGGTSQGLLTLDSERLSAALDENPLAVRQFLAGDGVTDGMATALAKALEPITRSGDGIMAIREEGFEDQIDVFDRTIERMEFRLEKREELLILQFSRLEELVSSLQGQQTFLANALQQSSNRN